MSFVCILATGVPRRFNLGVPKALIRLYDDFTILDYQMGLLKKFGLDNITIILNPVLGQQIIYHCSKRDYNVKFIWDITPTKEDNAHFTLLNMKDYFLTVQKPLILIYDDQMFNETALLEMLSCNGDICRVHSQYHGLLKFTQKGMEEFLTVIGEYTGYKNNKPYTHNTSSIIAEIRRRNKIDFTEIKKGSLTDIDIRGDLIRVKEGHKWK